MSRRGETFHCETDPDDTLTVLAEHGFGEVWLSAKSPTSDSGFGIGIDVMVNPDTAVEIAEAILKAVEAVRDE